MKLSDALNGAAPRLYVKSVFVGHIDVELHLLALNCSCHVPAQTVTLVNYYLGIANKNFEF